MMFLVQHHNCGTNLKANGSRRTRETSGTFISLLSKHTLLTSGAGLSITSLVHEKEKFSGGVMKYR